MPDGLQVLRDGYDGLERRLERRRNIGASAPRLESSSNTKRRVHG